MSVKNQEDILDQVILSIKSKRLELSKLQDDFDSVLKEKTICVGQVMNLQSEVKRLSAERVEVKNVLNKLKDEYEKQVETLILKEEAVANEEKKVAQLHNDLNINRDKMLSEKEVISKDFALLKAERIKLDENKRVMAREWSKVNEELTSLSKQREEFGKIKDSYKEKMLKVESSQSIVYKNIEKSEALKQILNDRISENQILRNKLNGEENTLIMAKKNFEDKRVRLEEDLALAVNNAEAQRAHFEAKLKLQETQDRDIEIKRLRVEKIVREKGVAKELADLEKEINGK